MSDSSNSKISETLDNSCLKNDELNRFALPGNERKTTSSKEWAAHLLIVNY